MKTQYIQSLTTSFESHAQQPEAGVDFWLARDVQPLLGDAKWRNFELVIAKATIAREGSEHEAKHRFVNVNKTVSLGSGSEHAVAVCL